MKNKKVNNSLTIKLSLSLVTIVLFSYCGQGEQTPANAKKSIQYDQALPKTVAIKIDNPEYQISVPAELRPYEQVALYAKVTGFVQRLFVDRGSFVKKGQLLAVLEAPEMDQRLNADRSSEQRLYSDYLFAKQSFDRLKEASRTEGAVADIELERSKNAMESSLAAYNASKAGTAGTSQLRQYLNIRAPFDGVITDRNVSVGALVGTTTNVPLFMIAQGNRLRLTLSLPEKHAASIHQDMPATFTVSSRPGETFSTKLSRSASLLDQRDRSLKIEFDVPNSQNRLQGGDYAQVKLRLKRTNPTFWVPEKSVINSQSGTFLFILNQGKIKKVAVKEGIRVNSLTEVFGQLKQEDMVLLNPSEETKEGKVNTANNI